MLAIDLDPYDAARQRNKCHRARRLGWRSHTSEQRHQSTQHRSTPHPLVPAFQHGKQTLEHGRIEAHGVQKEGPGCTKSALRQEIALLVDHGNVILTQDLRDRRPVVGDELLHGLFPFALAVADPHRDLEVEFDTGLRLERCEH